MIRPNLINNKAYWSSFGHSKDDADCSASLPGTSHTASGSVPTRYVVRCGFPHRVPKVLAYPILGGLEHADF